VTLPAGFERRPATAGDAALAADVARAYEAAHLGAAETTQADLEDDWGELDPAADVWLVEDANAAAVAYAALYRDGEAQVVADGYVLPTRLGLGLGRYLIESTESRARDLAAAVIHNGVLAQDERGQELLAGCGYRAARRFVRMVIDLAEAPAASELPTGVSVRPFRPDEEAEAFHAAVNEAFAEHWGHVPETFERWREVTMGSTRFDPGLWLVAEEDREIAGVARCTWKASDIGWVNDLGVRPRSRGRGIGLGLLTRAFGEFHARGETTVGLGVDTANETGATRLYEAAGMRPTWEAVIFEKKLR